MHTMKTIYNPAVAGFSLFFWATFCMHANAHDYQVGELTVKHPYALPSEAGLNHGAVFIKKIQNLGKISDQLIAARTPIARKMEIHDLKSDGHVTTMRSINAIHLSPGGEVSVAKGNPNGYHLMLLDLKQPLRDGDSFVVWLTFKNAGEVEVDVSVDAPKSLDKPEK